MRLILDVECSCTQIKKKTTHTSLANYNPVGITSTFPELFENISKKRLEDHSKKAAIKKGKSTVKAMPHELNNWTTCSNSIKSVDMIYLDFCKDSDKASACS